MAGLVDRLAWQRQASEHRRLICQGVTADAHAEPTALAGRPAHRVRPLLHPTDHADLPSTGGRSPGSVSPMPGISWFAAHAISSRSLVMMRETVGWLIRGRRPAVPATGCGAATQGSS